jgi:hypothetical protein
MLNAGVRGSHAIPNLGEATLDLPGSAHYVPAVGDGGVAYPLCIVSRSRAIICPSS